MPTWCRWWPRSGCSTTARGSTRSRLTRVGDYLYGRGTIDDKGSIAAVLYAMKAVKESGLPLDRTIRLMIETTEETGGDA